MPVADPETFVQVLRDLVTQAVTRGAGQQVRDRLNEAGDDADALWEDIKKLGAPSWWSLVLFAFTEVQKLDSAQFKLGMLRDHLAGATNWWRVLTVAYHPGGGAAAPLTLGLALSEHDGPGALLLLLDGDASISFGTPDALKLHVDSGGTQAAWQLPFNGPPDGDAHITATVTWHLPVPEIPPVPGTKTPPLSLGPLYFHGEVDTDTPRCAITVGLGCRGLDGVRIHLSPMEALGKLGEIVHIGDIDEAYSPNAHLETGQRPSFALGYRGPDGED